MFELHVNVDSLELAKSGSIWGDVWISFPEEEFPHENWNDMVIPYLAALAECLRAVMVSGISRQVSFYDGPYSIHVAPGRGAAILLKPEGGLVVKGVEVPSAVLVAQLVECGDRLIAACNKRGWSANRDVRQLQDALLGIRAVLSS
ncbi:hypothetical protein ACFC4G_44305 [Streptomyces sp. NPDC056002]|uniref:hypothetical protein n=1 Tax=Streptomyces sp. NPDC056002 TaxID=3345675 RepID=UPI0035DE4627